MNYFAPGIRELSRIIARGRARWRLRGARKRLASVEGELGLLGWQQAEFDSETQQEVDKILRCEREQARLTNESAALTQAIAELRTLREQARLAFEQKSAPLAAERQAIRENIAKAGAQMSALKRQAAEMESTEPQLDRELRKARLLHSELLAIEQQTPAMRDQQLEQRDRMNSIPGKLAEVQRQRTRIAGEIDELQKSVARDHERETALASQTRELESAHSTEDRKLADAIAGKEREREKMEAENARIEKEKTSPYRAIGRVLADNQLPPMNQPQALDAVRECRLGVQEIEYAIAKSRADSAAEDRGLMQNSFILLGAVTIAVVLVLGALIRW